jgi:RNA polymerase sigma-70 factor (ECF subfamily)
MVGEIGLPLYRTLGLGGEVADTELLEGCRSGALCAYEALYRTHGGRMKSLAFHMLGDLADAEDAVQEAFLKLYRGIDGFAGNSSFSTWVYRILINACRDQQRKAQRQRPGVLPPQLAAQPSADPPLRVALERALAALDERRRMVFVMFEVEGMRHSEIATVLDVSENTSRSLLFEARQQLKRMLTEKRS